MAQALAPQAGIGNIREEVMTDGGWSPVHVGRHMNVSRTAAWLWMKRGVKGVLLESVRLGKLYRTSEAALARFIDRVGGAEALGRHDRAGAGLEVGVDVVGVGAVELLQA